jgi:tRNA threonylcarbamoyladenosine biosynthesis protein TsaE
LSLNKTYLFSEHEIAIVAKSILEAIPKPSIILLEGQMGAGKTTLIKQLCEALGVEDGVSSPTYAIVNDYQGKEFRVFHFDLYRLKDDMELLDLGFEEYLYQNAYVFIEWPQLAMPFLPNDCVKLQLKIENDKRQLHLQI